MLTILEPGSDNFITFSDAHIGANASVFKEDDVQLNKMIDQCRGRRHVILNGDFLDITLNITNGARHPTIGEDERYALGKRMDRLMPKLAHLLARLHAESPDTQVHYLLGNHDGVDEFRQRLDIMAQHSPNLRVHEDMLRMGDVLFVHGDQDIAHCTREEVKAFRQARLLNRGELGPAEIEMYHNTYDNIQRRRAEDGDTHPVSRVFLGHTHLGAESIELPEVSISNGGVFREDGVAYVFKGQFTDGALSELGCTRTVGPNAGTGAGM